MRRDPGPGRSRTHERSSGRAAAIDFVRHPGNVDDGPVRLGVALALSAAAVGFFRQDAAPMLLAAVVGAVAILAVLHQGYHRIGLRWAGRLWPGATRGLATGMLFFCLCPPGLPVALVLTLSAAAVLVEGGLRRLTVPLAVSGVMFAWPLAWLWHVHSGAGFVGPFQLRTQLDPIELWTRFQFELDPLRLYTGNVAGLLGSTSFGLAMVGFTVLAYLRKASWAYLLGFYAPIALLMGATRNSLPTYLVSGASLVFAGLIGAETRKLPLATGWRAGAGAAAGALSAALLLRGGGPEAYAVGVIGAAMLVSFFQLFGLAGSPAVVSSEVRGAGGAAAPAGGGRTSAAQVAALVLFAPLGLVLVWRDHSLPPSQRQLLAGLGLALYVVVVAGSLAWLWALRLPA